ncbi:MBOAT family O-acyltransferase [Robertkochia aurantiaca]|uniref:MBOAT family O-acyltransferase n=1 Tax=Robertkochia aurantiaca TaxID=2873700 RepID=UPI001CCDDFD1|nr:MBOAT family O-acyltransferase [Robertkochia sp. 3YJGBD-33]
MLFNSFDFLFFFPLVALVFYLLPHFIRWAWLLLASYFFYMWLEPSLIILLMASTCLDYFCALKMEQINQLKRRKFYLWLSIGGNLGMLFFFKYFIFFTESSRAILAFFGIDWLPEMSNETYSFNKILLPIGISFYTFQTLSYSIDVYRREIKPIRHFGKYALYVAFFPQLVAGPIERAHRLIPQFYKKIKLDIRSIKIGITMMAWGFFLKLVVADRLGVYVDEVFYDPSRHRGLPLFIGSLFFSFQIYFDFSAYCTIAVGAARVLGYDLMQNFNKPIFMKSFGDFWRRWHISLMLWLRDYLYIPLIRKFGTTKAMAAMIVFVCNGLWHGANWTFVVWGAICGLFMLLEASTKNLRHRLLQYFGISRKSLGLRLVTWAAVFLSLSTSLIFFRSPDIGTAAIYLRRMVSLSSTYVNVTQDYLELALCFFLIIVVQTIHYFKGNDKVYELVTFRPVQVRWGIYLTFILVIVLFSVNRQNNFIYFQF